MAPDTAPGILTLDTAARTAAVDGAPLDLTDPEHRLLAALATKAGTVVTRSELSHALYSDKPKAAESNVIEVVISRLRRKLREAGVAGGGVETLRALGYRYSGQVA